MAHIKKTFKRKIKGNVSDVSGCFWASSPLKRWWYRALYQR